MRVNAVFAVSLLVFGVQNGIAFAAPAGQPAATAVSVGPAAGVSSGATANVMSADQTSVVKRLWTKYNRLGELALARKQPDLALQMFGQALDEAKLLGLSHPAFANTYDGLMKSYAMQGRFDDSVQACSAALALREKTLGKNHPIVAKNLVDMATLYQRMNRKADADALMRRAASIQGGSGATSGPGTTPSVLGQAKLAVEQGRLAEAAQLFEKVIIADAQKGVDPNEAASHLEEFAAMRWQQGMLNQSTMLLTKAMALREKANADSDMTRALLRNYARACALTGRIDEANTQVQKLLRYDRTKLSPSSPDFAFDLCTLGLIKLSRAEYAAAEMALESALDTQEKAAQANDPDLADTLSAMARVYVATGKGAEAEKLFRRSLEIKEHSHYPDLLKVDDYEGLSKVIASANASEASQLQQKASAIRQKTPSQVATNPAAPPR